jgi:hypothetical protein
MRWSRPAECVAGPSYFAAPDVGPWTPQCLRAPQGHRSILQARMPPRAAHAWSAYMLHVQEAAAFLAADERMRLVLAGHCCWHAWRELTAGSSSAHLGQRGRQSAPPRTSSPLPRHLRQLQAKMGACVVRAARSSSARSTTAPRSRPGPVQTPCSPQLAARVWCQQPAHRQQHAAGVIQCGNAYALTVDAIVHWLVRNGQSSTAMSAASGNHLPHSG